MDHERRRYLRLLAQKYPTVGDVYREIINLTAIMNLPKGTEHFMSDLHGEYDAFYHIFNNCSGVVREKVEVLFKDTYPPEKLDELCTLIYYPAEKLALLREAGKLTEDWYQETLRCLVDLAKLLSSKYTRSKVRKAMPAEFAYILDELLHVQKDEDDNQVTYHRQIFETIIKLDSGDEFITALTGLIKQLAVDHLHILGDIYDRGGSPDRIIDLLMKCHSIDIEWGNHDAIWMGAAAGSRLCVAQAVRNSLRYGNTDVLEKAYGIGLRNLYLAAKELYPDYAPKDSAYQLISMILEKEAGRAVLAYPEWQMEERAHLADISLERGQVMIDGAWHNLKVEDFPTLDPAHPYDLCPAEEEVLGELTQAFLDSGRLQQHIGFLYSTGSMYRKFNGNLLYHGCIPMNEDGSLKEVVMEGVARKGRAYLDYCDMRARRAFFGRAQEDSDFMWYLWNGRLSPLYGRKIRSFEHSYVENGKQFSEERDPYYTWNRKEEACCRILKEFHLEGNMCHIINGHTPVRVIKGESPVRANGKLLVIDGGLCESLHRKTGIAGYTLIFNSHGLLLKAHDPFLSVEDAVERNSDIHSSVQIVETEQARVMVGDSDVGKKLREDVADLGELLSCYRSGMIAQGNRSNFIFE